MASAQALAVASPATAQDKSAAPAATRERTGPNADTASIPRFAAEPVPGIMPPSGPPSAAVPTDGTITLTGVRISVEPAGAVAHAQPGWTPTGIAEAGVHLVHAPGEPLDGRWVERQFQVNGLIGRPVPLDRLASLVQLINLAYVRNGYLNSGLLIPRGAATADGTLLLTLVMGRTVALTSDGAAVGVRFGAGGAKGLDQGYIRHRLASAAVSPLNAVTLEREFRLLAADPAIRSINADLRPGQRPGEALVDFTVVPQDRLDLYVGFANNRSPSIGGERWSIGGTYRNALAAGDLLSAEYGETGGHGDLFGSYELPFLRPGVSLVVRGGKNDAAVVDSQLRALDIRSREWVIEGGINVRVLDRPLTPGAPGTRATPAETLTAGLRFGHRDQRTTLLGEPFSFSPGAVDGRAAYDAGRLTLDYVRRDMRQVIAVSLTGTRGFGGTRSDIPGLLSPARHFLAFLGQVSFARRLDDKGLELRLRLVGQVAGGTLYSSERFSAGGENSVRGYRENLLLADEGLFASAELVRSFSIGGAGRRHEGVDLGAFSISAFIDGATLHNSDAVQPSPKTIGSVGASLAWEPMPALSARVTYGKALKHVDPAGRRDLQDRGVSFRIVVRPLLLLHAARGPSA